MLSLDNSKLLSNLILVTRFIDKILFDIYRRVPTQIDWSILLKSFAFSALALRQDAYNTLPTLKVNIKLSSSEKIYGDLPQKKQVTKLKPGDVLLSHGETPHYHRRCFVSRLSSAWIQVGPKRYGRQANFFQFEKLILVHNQVSKSPKTPSVLYG